MLENVRIPKESILGSPDIDTKKSFAGVTKTFDNTRPVVAAMAVGVARAALDRTREIFQKQGIATDGGRTGNSRAALQRIGRRGPDRARGAKRARARSSARDCAGVARDGSELSAAMAHTAC